MIGSFSRDSIDFMITSHEVAKCINHVIIKAD